MYVRHLSVADFRSWTGADVTFEPGPAVLVGANGQGKTNLIEAIGYLSTLSSHRVSTDAPLIRAGAERAVIRAAVVADARELRVELEIVPGRANRARLNGAPVPRPREIVGALRTVLFAPEDLAIVRGDPSERRRFLDDLVVARLPRMAGVRSDYERVLRQRAALLKSAGAARRSAGTDLPTLDVWDSHLAEHGSQLLWARLDTLRALRPWANAAYAQVAPTSVELTMRYASGLAEHLPALLEPDAVAEPGELRDALLAGLVAARPAELDRGVNLVGPHRDDVELGLGELPVRGYASHGEGWSVALSLRLGSYELLRADPLPGGDPVLILDDVFAELDGGRREQLALVAGKAEQALVTAAVGGDVPVQLLGARYEVSGGTVFRVPDSRSGLEGPVGDEPVGDDPGVSGWTPSSTDDGGQEDLSVDSEALVASHARDIPPLSDHDLNLAVDNPVDTNASAVDEGPDDLALSALANARVGSGQRPRRRGPRRGEPVEETGRNRGGYSGPGHDPERDPHAVGSLLDGFVAGQGWQTQMAHARVFAGWDQLVGADVAAHCRPVSLREGELKVSAQSTAWATQLRLLSSMLLARLVDQLGPELVTRIVISGPVGPSWKHGPRTVRGHRGPRDTYG